MTALVFDRIGFETEASQTVPTSSKCPREEEFRAALDRYMADYIACQKRRDIGRHGDAECHRDGARVAGGGGGTAKGGAARADQASSAPARRLGRCLSCLSAPW